MDPLSTFEPSELATMSPVPSQEWLSQTIQLRAELLFDTRKQGGRDIYVIEDTVRCKFYQIGVTEFELVSRLDGKSTVGEVLKQINTIRRTPISEASASQICSWLIQNNLGFATETDSGKRLSAQAKSLQKQKILSLVNPIAIKFKLFNPTQILNSTQKYLQWIFSFQFALVWIATGFAGLYFLFGNWDKLGQASIGILAEGKWMWMLLVWLVLKAIHEWAHGIACRRYGGDVPEAGLLLLLFTPMPYVNVTSSWRFRNRWHRFVVAVAGMYVELFISFIAMIVWANSSNQFIQDICFNIFFLSSVTTVLFNANPLMRFDGYYMLTDAVNIPNLYTKGLRWFADRLKSTLFGTPKTKNICPSNELPLVRIYGICAFCWKVLISFSLLIAASVLFYGLGIIMAVGAGLLWLGAPVVRFFKSSFGGPNPNFSLGRVVFSSFCIVALVASVFTWLGSPAKKSAPAIVQFSQEEVLRAGGDGFIAEIFVTNGQSVKAGERLLSIRNDELSTEVSNLRRSVEESEIQARIHTKARELADAQTVLQNRESLLSQLHEKEEQLENLQLVAPFDGIVSRRNLSNIQGEYYQHGTELLRIASSKSQKVVVSIDQGDLDSIKGREGNTMTVVMPGIPKFQAAITSIESRADVRPKYKAFCASFGGPLPVKNATASADRPNESDQPFQFLSPRFQVELDIDRSEDRDLQCGQIGRVFFESQRQSLGQYLYLETRNWFQKQIKQAANIR